MQKLILRFAVTSKYIWNLLWQKNQKNFKNHPDKLNFFGSILVNSIFPEEYKALGKIILVMRFMIN